MQWQVIMTNFPWSSFWDPCLLYLMLHTFPWAYYYCLWCYTDDFFHTNRCITSVSLLAPIIMYISWLFKLNSLVGGRSVGIVCSRTQTMEFVFVCLNSLVDILTLWFNTNTKLSVMYSHHSNTATRRMKVWGVKNFLVHYIWHPPVTQISIANSNKHI
jgi:hypothetical protein